MKKILVIAFLLTSLIGVSIASPVKYGVIRAGYTSLSKPMAFTAADSTLGNGGFHIFTSDSVVISITNIQKYLQHQTITTTLTDVHGGSPSVVITLRGRTTSTDNWHPIGTAVTWTSTGNNPATITSTVPQNYNYLKVSYVASGATQHLKIATFDIRTANVYDIGKVSAMVLGDGTGTIAVNSSDWDISATGVQTGMGAITSNGLITTTAGVAVTGAISNINVSSNFATNINTGTSNALVSIGGGSNTLALNSTAWGITSAGVYSGLSYTGAPTVIWAAGGSTVLATSGTDVACANGTRFWVELNIPYKVSLTGIAYLVGSVGGTDSVVVQLHNSAGVEVATSKKTGANHGAIVGTAAQFQSCPFYVGASATPYVAAPGKYFVSVQFNGTTAKFRAYPIPGSKFITGTAAGTWNTAANITPGTTFTADKGPIIMTY